MAEICKSISVCIHNKIRSCFMKILISACLMGVCCRYDGTGKDVGIKDRYPQVEFVNVCPELMGGLSAPRSCAEISHDRVVDINGKDFTEEYTAGAKKTLKIAKENDCTVAILKAKSPSCGSGLVYDGTFSGKLVPGDGISVALLKANGIKVFSEERLEELDEYLQQGGLE